MPSNQQMWARHHSKFKSTYWFIFQTCHKAYAWGSITQPWSSLQGNYFLHGYECAQTHSVPRVRDIMYIKNRIQTFYSISHFTAWKQNVYVLKASPASFWEIFSIQFIMQNLHLMLDSNLARECVNLSEDKWLMQPELIQQCPYVLRDGMLWMYYPTQE